MDSCLNVNISRIQGLLPLTINEVGRAISVSLSRIGDSLSVRCGLVCSVNDDSYLRVPIDNIWLIPDNGFSQDVVVYSNVSWIIE